MIFSTRHGAFLFESAMKHATNRNIILQPFDNHKHAFNYTALYHVYHISLLAPLVDVPSAKWREMYTEQHISGFTEM